MPVVAHFRVQIRGLALTAAENRGPIPHDQPFGHLVVILPAFCPQIPPTRPFLPVMPVVKYCAVYNLRFEMFHGMEEVDPD
jgi:hypothetical protein